MRLYFEFWVLEMWIRLRLVCDDFDHGSFFDVVKLVQRLEMRRAIHADVTLDHVWEPCAPLVAGKLARRYREDLVFTWHVSCIGEFSGRETNQAPRATSWQFLVAG